MLLSPTVAVTVTMESPGSTGVTVTGASTGIGRAIVEYLAARGDYVFAAARKDRDLGELGRLQNVVPVRIDVTQTVSVVAAVAQVRALTATLDVLVNNAGFVVAGPLMEVTPEEMRAQLERSTWLASTASRVPFFRSCLRPGATS